MQQSQMQSRQRCTQRNLPLVRYVYGCSYSFDRREIEGVITGAAYFTWATQDYDGDTLLYYLLSFATGSVDA